jgi:hypothetical protein
MLDLDLLDLLFGNNLHLLILEAFQLILKESLLAADTFGFSNLFYVSYGPLQVPLCFRQPARLGHGIIEGGKHKLLVVSSVQEEVVELIRAPVLNGLHRKPLTASHLFLLHEILKHLRDIPTVLGVELQQIIQGLRLPDLSLLTEARVDSEYLSPQLLFNHLHAEEDELLQEINDQALSHLSSKGHCLGFVCQGIHGVRPLRTVFLDYRAF